MKVWDSVKRLFLPASPSSYSPPNAVTLHEWWLTSIKTNDGRYAIGVEGITAPISQNQAERCFTSAPILKAFDYHGLETVDGIHIILDGNIDKEKTLQNGFPPKVFDHFKIGFPENWEEFAVDTGVQGHDPTVFSNEIITVPDASSLKVPHVTLHEWWLTSIKTNDDGRDAIGVEGITAPIFPNQAEGCFTSAPILKVFDYHGLETVDGIHIILDGNIDKEKTLKNGFPPKVFDHFKIGFPENWEEFDVCGESEASTSASDIGAHHSKAKCSDPLSGRSVGVGCSANTSTEKSNLASGVTDPNENTVVSKTNMETCQNKKRNNKDMFSRSCREDSHTTPTATRHEIDSQEGSISRSKSKIDLKSGNSAERRRIAISPKSPTTTSKAKKGSKDTYKSPTILSPESFSGKRSRSGRVLLPPLEFWRNQKVLYDPDRQLVGVEEPM